jgi:hypothetical protein
VRLGLHVLFCTNREGKLVMQSIAVGRCTPFPIFLEDGAKIDIQNNQITIIVQLSRPLKSEVRAIRRGRMDVSTQSVGSSAVLLWRFLPCAAGLPPIFLDTPFHLGLLPPDQRSWQKRDGQQRYVAMIVLQDERGICHGGRLASLPAGVCDEIDRVATQQIEEARLPGWSPRRHNEEIAKFHRIWPRNDQAWDASEIKGRGGM